MAINSEIRDQAYLFFIEEAPELLQTLEAGILSLSQDHGTAKIHDLMRAAHTIKGGAASVGLEAIASLAHRLETIFQALYGDALAIDSDLENQLLQVYDCLRLPLMEQLTSGSFDVDRALAAAEPVFAQIEARLGDALRHADSYFPSSAELGVDMVAEMMSVDVAQQLQRLAAIVAQPQEHNVAGELRAQTEVFIGIAELFNLSGFCAIAEATQRALESHPDRVLEIAQLALNDFEHSRQVVLAERTHTTGPSEALAALAVTTTEAIPETNTAACWATVEPMQTALPLVDDVFGHASSVLQTTSRDDALATDRSIAVEVFYASDALEPSLSDNSEASQSETLRAGSLVPLPLEFDEALQLSHTAEPYAEQTPHPRSPFTGEASATTTANLTVRVDAERLERMSNLIGELTINRDSLSLQNEQVQRVQRELLERFSRFQERIDQLGKLSDQMFIDFEKDGYGAAKRHPVATTAFSPTYIPGFAGYQPSASTVTAGFDPLEFDRYGVVHSQLQEILEEMGQLEEAVDDMTLLAKQSNQALEEQRQLLIPLRDEVINARMLPLGEVLNRFPRVLRELSVAYQKPVDVTISGSDVLLDRAILEKLYDPLLHIIRNAFDHGIEPLNIRQQDGKPEHGHIEVRTYRKGNQTVIQVKDDGQGLNLAKIRDRAFELGWLTADQLAVTAPEQLFELIFEPGFSTAQQVSQLSGRGMGLDVVRSQLRAINGTVTVTSSPQRGTTFTLYLPVTLTIAQLLIVLAGSSTLAFPVDSIEEIISPDKDAIRRSGEQRFLNWQEKIIPVYRLVDRLNYTCPLPEASTRLLASAIPHPEHFSLPLLILRQDQQVFALEVDQLITEQELVIKPFGSAIAPPSYVYGCTVLGDGSLIPVVDGIALLSVGVDQATASTSRTKDISPSSTPLQRAIKTVRAPMILVVDDAVTLRRALALSLERAGFRVLQARDGQEAISQLQQHPSVQLVICDIEMPKMNGFEFLSHRRQAPQMATIPVIMLTSRSNDKHRWLAMQLGATAYFTKPYLERELLATLKNLIHEEGLVKA